ncbi:SMP-30/gluconolactonase/LRE family protein [Bradyrhizobium jicamae]|uniref:SMP-30/gluconolactonase/LRE family protein n=1 Tax=Bradyrhizobium jicamae TaxID=280332 RepID=UPI001BABE684|nr:SMP-30/gluconolactonase/LRE family protein [Bradyrhizobium jicamae]MBR0755453.1 SMP-30/gluconolactonase/LRE family protein [Bradyrhizobium jicamae]
MLPHVTHDPRFERLVFPHVNLEKLTSGCRWAEGPAYFPAGCYLVWSDIPNNRMMRFDETDGSVSVFRAPSFNSNGNTTDRQGRLVSCEHLMRRVTRTEHDGSITVLADQFDGRRLNSPNDAVVKSDDSIWFSDPTYGIDSDYEGLQSPSEIGANNVYRIDAATGKVTCVVSGRVQPNGLAFSPDEKLLYVADTGATHVRGLPATIWSYRVDGARTTGDASLFATCPEGLYDGFRCDIHGNIWTSAGRSVFCYAPDGTHLGTIPIGEIVANVCFGGPRRNRLYICGQTSLYSIYLNTRAAV